MALILLLLSHEICFATVLTASHNLICGQLLF